MPNRFFVQAKSLHRNIVFIVAVLGFLFFPQPVWAGFQPVGFQWVAPPEAAPAPAYAPTINSAPAEALPPVMPAPAAPVTKAPSSSLAGENPEVISPIVIEGAPLTPSSSSTQSIPGRGPASLGTMPASGSAPIPSFRVLRTMSLSPWLCGKFYRKVTDIRSIKMLI